MQSNLALEFLLKWCATGPWTLTAISPLKEGIVTRTFRHAQLQEMQTWLQEYNGKWNLYFTINKTFTELSNKPRKEDISTVQVLHLDVDPRVGEDIPNERLRILKSLQEFKPRPSLITDSGTGYQCFWWLQQPIVLDGTVQTAEDAESYSIQLELLLGADRCGNCDRVMRIPGTWNLPDEVKKKKGRVLALSSVVEWEGTQYPLSAFTKAPIKIQRVGMAAGEESLAGGGEQIKISGNLNKIYIDDLPKKNITIPDHIKVLIVQGHNPDNPTQYPSRSEALWAVVCELVRAQADTDTIAGIILNKDNAISASVLDKPRPERYAAKQIQDAREEVDDPVLRELNARHCVISDVGGRCRIISEIFDYALHRTRISYCTFDDFRNRYLHRKAQVATDKEGQPVCRPLGDWWTKNPKRRQYETIVFAPGREVPQAYNLWRGFACEAIPGNCTLFIEHIESNLCKKNKEYMTYLLSWMARCVQQPDCPGEVAIVLRGEMGTGKGVFCKHFGSLFGRHFLQISDSKHLVGNFNSHLRDCVVLFGDEALWAGDKKHESVLKSLITEPTIAVESKGVDVISCPNYTHIILASNSNWVVPAGGQERRFFALDVSSDKMQDKKYFAALQEQMNSGGREALLHFLLSYDLTAFEVRDVPKTEALQDQKLLSLGSEEQWWFEKLEEGRILSGHNAWEREVMKNELQDDYILFMQRTGILRKVSPTVLGKFLGRMCPNGVPRSYQRMATVKVLGQYGEEYAVNRRVYFYEFPKLEECREQWDKHHGGPFKWAVPLERDEQIRLPPTEPFK